MGIVKECRELFEGQFGKKFGLYATILICVRTARWHCNVEVASAEVYSFLLNTACLRHASRLAPDANR
eukprot:2272393-Amphidinium_carterae.1